MIVFAYLILIARAAVFILFLYAVVIALTHWAVRGKRLSPFGAWPRFVRRIADPVLPAVERRVIRSGGNPQQAPLWFLIAVVLGGLVLLSLIEWLVRTIFTLVYLANTGPRGIAVFAVEGLFTILMVALIVRVVGSWLGVSPYSRWMRPVMVLTDWLVEPLRRVIPPLGMIDVTPMVAYLLLLLARSAALSLVR